MLFKDDLVKIIARALGDEANEGLSDHDMAYEIVNVLEGLVEEEQAKQAEEAAELAAFDDVPFVAVGSSEEPPWGNERTCLVCGKQNLPLQDSKPPGLHFITHCGKTWIRGPIEHKAFK